MSPRLACLVTLALAWGQLAFAAEPAPAAVVELPPMVIEEAASVIPWLYAHAGGEEYLSHCTERTTREYIAMRRSRFQWIDALFPAEFFLHSDVPVTTILTSQLQRSAGNSEVIGAVLDTRKGGPGTGYTRTTTAPNMLLNDTDSVAVYAYIDEDKFDRTRLTISSDYVGFLLDRRTPALPLWLREGIIAAYNDVQFAEEPITLRPLVWLSTEENHALLRDPESPRALLAPGDLFADPNRLPPHVTLARAQCALLVRWALDPRHGARDAFWRFAARAAEGPVNEAVFESYLGFGFTDLRDRLSDYLPQAVKSPLVLPLGKLPSAPRDEVRRATPGEIARLRGEWERLSVPLVRRRYPTAADRYLEQARRTLHRAYDAGDRDPRLLATLGLCEVDAGENAAALEFLEPAVNAQVVRPRAYFELTRLQWRELVRGQPPDREFTYPETKPLAELLLQSFGQTPALPESFGLLADIWLRAKTAPTDAQVQLVVSHTAQFAPVPRVCLRMVRALARHGKMPEALALLGEGFRHVSDDPTRQEFAALYQALGKVK